MSKKVAINRKHRSAQDASLECSKRMTHRSAGKTAGSGSAER